jgi:hypothetical protein
VAALKALVIGMGILIIVGVVVLFATLASRMGGNKQAWESRVILPDGFGLVGIAGTQDRVILHTRGSTGEAVLLAIDPATGKTLGRVVIEGATP